MRMEIPAKKEKFYTRQKGQDWYVSTDPSFLVFSMVDGKLIPSTMTGSVNRLPREVREALQDFMGEAPVQEQPNRVAPASNPEVRTSKPQ